VVRYIQPGTQVKTENELKVMAAIRPRCRVNKDSLTIGGICLEIREEGWCSRWRWKKAKAIRIAMEEAKTAGMSAEHRSVEGPDSVSMDVHGVFQP